LTRNVAPGIHRLAHANVNCYLVVEGEDVTIVDAAFPTTWGPLLRALRAVGRSPADVAALVLTHAHFDHLGFASRVVSQLQVPVWLHPADASLAARPYRYAHESSRLVYPLLYPMGVPRLLAMTLAGAWNVPGVDEVRDLPASGELDVPGSPSIVFTPGHTFGHCALHFPGRETVLSGDALVTLDPYKGARGPQIVAGAATADSELALRSLSPLADTEARILLPGHGEPWRAGARAAVDAAIAVGPS